MCVHVFCRLQRDFAQCKTELNVILEKEKKMTSDLTERLEDEKRQHANTRTLLEQVHHTQCFFLPCLHLFYSTSFPPFALILLLFPLTVKNRSEAEKALRNIRETLQQHAAIGTHNKHITTSNTPDVI